MALESGRYMETLRWLSMESDDDNSKNVTFSRRYLDPSWLTYEFYTSKKTNHFDARAGEQVRSFVSIPRRPPRLHYCSGTIYIGDLAVEPF